MRRVQVIVIHPDHFERLIDAAADFFGLYTHIFRTKRRIFLYDGCDNLIIRILKHHTAGTANVPQLFFIHGIHSIHPDSAAGRQIDGVAHAGKRGFSRAVSAQNRGELSIWNCKIHTVQRQMRCTGKICIAES